MTKDRAYKIATSQYLNAQLTYEAFTIIDIEPLVRDFYECFAVVDIRTEITDLAHILLYEELPVIAKDTIEDLVAYAEELPSNIPMTINSTDLKLLAMCYTEEVEEDA